MRNKTLKIAIAAALLSSGAAMAQVKGPGAGTEPEGPSNSAPLGGGLPGISCTAASGTNCPAAIPDSSAGVPGTLTSTLLVNGCTEAVTDVNVGLDVSHTWVGDLQFTVRAPNDAAVLIVDRPGVPASTFGCAGDDIFASLDDEAGSPVETECAGATPTISGSFTPNNPLSGLDGVDGNGTWTLEVTDNAGGDTGALNDWSVELTAAGCAGGQPATDPIARFQVIKDFDDDSTASVDVEISCNTGLPLSQPATVEEGDPITFIVTDFADGELNCSITETNVEGYTASYDNGTVSSAVSCAFENVGWETFQTCTITNSLDPVTVEVTKWWMDENPANNPINYAEADYSCADEAFGDVSGTLEFLGDGAVDSFTVFPRWDGITTCTVTETVVDNGVEFDDSECASLSVTPGNGASCNIYNTRLYEGIPTLSHYGLSIMALLMLGVGFVAFRRIA